MIFSRNGLSKPLREKNNAGFPMFRGGIAGGGNGRLIFPIGSYTMDGIRSITVPSHLQHFLAISPKNK
jgi:hypothetical protein